MNEFIKELKMFEGNLKWYEKHGNGYRIVYFYSDGSYIIGAISKTIEGFMINFCDTYPIEDESDIPEFISIDDLLNRYLNYLNYIVCVGLYKMDGTCIQKKSRDIEKNNIKN